MQVVKDLFSNYRIVPVKSRRSERGDLITEFTERINAERGDRKLFTISTMSYFLSVFKTPDLYVLLNKCNHANSFTACFWAYVKPRNKA